MQTELADINARAVQVGLGTIVKQILMNANYMVTYVKTVALVSIYQAPFTALVQVDGLGRLAQQILMNVSFTVIYVAMVELAKILEDISIVIA